MNPWLFAALLAAADPVAATPEPSRAIAVLPFSAPSEVLSDDGLDLLSRVLASHLAELGRLRVISPDELRALLQTEAHRQALGGGEDDALREISGALGAAEVVSASVSKDGKRLTWKATLVRQADAAVLQQGEASASSLQALAAQADEVALQLLGRANELQDPADAARRLGFKSVEDVKDFRAFRAGHPELGTQEALTEYIIAHNVESNRIAVAETSLFVAGGALTTLALVCASMGFVLSAMLPLWFLALPFSLIAVLAGLTGLGLMGSATVLSAVDGLNRGFRPVRAEGCCRDDAQIQESVESSAMRRASAFAVLVGGPAFTAASFTVLVLLGTSSALLSVPRQAFGAPGPDEAYYASTGYLVSSAPVGLTYACAVFGCLTPCLLGLPLGTALLLWPSSPAVADLEEGAQ